jgi:hypothetical protein
MNGPTPARESRPAIRSNQVGWPAPATFYTHSPENNFIAKFCDSESAKRDFERSRDSVWRLSNAKLNQRE